MLAVRLNDTYFIGGRRAMVERTCEISRPVAAEPYAEQRRPPARPANDAARDAAAYWMRSKTLKIGIYIAMIIDPTIAPRKAIINGSMSAVSASVVASTSWS